MCIRDRIDKVRLAQLVRDARDPTSPLRRVWKSGGEKGPLVLPVPIVLDTTRTAETVLSFKDELDHPPVDARLNLEKRQVEPEVEGRKLDLDATVSAIQVALESGKISSPLVFQ